MVPVTPIKKRKTLKRYKNKTTEPFLIIFWGINADTLFFNYWEIQQIKITLKKVSFEWPTPTLAIETHARNLCVEHDVTGALTLVAADDVWNIIPVVMSEVGGSLLRLRW
jgi:hypothetical protein